MMESRVIEILPQDAAKVCEQDPRALLVDIRSSMEFLFVGHPKGAVNIAWIDEPDWLVNPQFTQEIRKLMLGGVVCADQGCAPVMLICRSGKRSLEAGAQLLRDGLENVSSVSGGFEGELNEYHHRSVVNGWRQAGLPWAQC